LLARIATGESNVYQQEMSAEKQSALLERISTQRARLERSFRNTMRDLEHLQQRRQARQQQPAQAAQAPSPRLLSHRFRTPIM
jgi:hypothetical protein